MDKVYLVGSRRKKIEQAAGRWVYNFVLAALSSLRDAGESIRFMPENGYDSFENLIASGTAPGVPKQLKRPFTVTTEARTLLTALLASVADVVNNTAPSADVGAYLSHAAPPFSLWFLLSSPHPRADRIRNLDSVECFQRKLELLVSARDNAQAAGAQKLVRSYAAFLKHVAWAATNFMVEQKFTLNKGMLRGILRNLEPPRAEVDMVVVMEFFTAQLQWTNRVDVPPKKKESGDPAAPACQPEEEEELDGVVAAFFDNY